MRFLLDTNILIYIANRRPPEVQARFARLLAGDMAMSVVTYLELIYGAQNSQRPRESLARIEQLENLIPILPFEKEVAMHYARLRVDLKQKGTPIGALDMLIAAHALSLGLTLVTNNTREFRRVQGLRVENWASTP